MSGDCINQPVIFYSEEMTEAKISLLLQNGVVFKSREQYTIFDEEEE
tara:strand:- start:287 stop:427 length:141 start_codon:yes stop_codon:yes gene_type:complete